MSLTTKTTSLYLRGDQLTPPRLDNPQMGVIIMIQRNWWRSPTVKPGLTPSKHGRLL